MEDAPCYKCTNRKLNCHSICSKYKSYNAYRETIRNARLKTHKVNDYFHDAIHDCIEKR